MCSVSPFACQVHNGRSTSLTSLLAASSPSASRYETPALGAAAWRRGLTSSGSAPCEPLQTKIANSGIDEQLLQDNVGILVNCNEFIVHWQSDSGLEAPRRVNGRLFVASRYTQTYMHRSTHTNHWLHRRGADIWSLVLLCFEASRTQRASTRSTC